MSQSAGQLILGAATYLGVWEWEFLTVILRSGTAPVWVCSSPGDCQCLVCSVGVCSKYRLLLNFHIFSLSTSSYVGHRGWWGGWTGGIMFPTSLLYKNLVKILVQGGGLRAFFPVKRIKTFLLFHIYRRVSTNYKSWSRFLQIYRNVFSTNTLGWATKIFKFD